MKRVLSFKDDSLIIHLLDVLAITMIAATENDAARELSLPVHPKEELARASDHREGTQSPIAATTQGVDRGAPPRLRRGHGLSNQPSSRTATHRCRLSREAAAAQGQEPPA